MVFGCSLYMCRSPLSGAIPDYATSALSSAAAAVPGCVCMPIHLNTGYSWMSAVLLLVLLCFTPCVCNVCLILFVVCVCARACIAACLHRHAPPLYVRSCVPVGVFETKLLVFWWCILRKSAALRTKIVRMGCGWVVQGMDSATFFRFICGIGDWFGRGESHLGLKSSTLAQK